MVLRSIDLHDVAVAVRVVEIQRAAYRVEADRIGFDRIPPLLETIDDVRSVPLSWLGSFEEHTLAGIIGWTVANGVCDIDRLAVHPAFGRRGHGRQLVSHSSNMTRSPSQPAPRTFPHVTSTRSSASSPPENTRSQTASPSRPTNARPDTDISA